MKDYDLLPISDFVFGGPEKILEWLRLIWVVKGPPHDEKWPIFTDKQKKSLKKILGDIGIDLLFKQYQDYMLRYIIMKDEMIEEAKKRFDLLKDMHKHVIALQNLIGKDEIENALDGLSLIYQADQCQNFTYIQFWDNLECIDNLLKTHTHIYNGIQNSSSKNEAKSYRHDFVLGLCNIYYISVRKMPWYGDKGTRGPIADILKIIPETEIKPGHYVINAVKAYKQFHASQYAHQGRF